MCMEFFLIIYAYFNFCEICTGIPSFIPTSVVCLSVSLSLFQFCQRFIKLEDLSEELAFGVFDFCLFRVLYILLTSHTFIIYFLIFAVIFLVS